MLVEISTFNNTFKQLLVFCFFLVLAGCSKQQSVEKIEGKRIEINEDLQTDSIINSFITPYQNKVNSELDSILAYSKDTYSKSDGEYNTAIGNLMADIVREQGDLIYTKRTSHKIDMVLLNHGGIRSILSKGPITVGDAYKIMPFENSIVVVELSGEIILKRLVPFLIRKKRAHPISGLKLHIDNNDNAIVKTINDLPIDPEKTYHIATNDYLYFGGDNMKFFQRGKMIPLDYKIRNAMIDYFKKYDTIQPKRDDRFLKI
ncbi:MAG: 5'-nucleotidase C-terminal domain-containing protein [bacterium]